MSILAVLALALAPHQQGVAVASHVDLAPVRDNPYRRFQIKDLKTTKVMVGKHEVTMWVMDTEDKREEGMMYLEAQDFTESQGMIFVFKSGEPLRFWMKNTFVPLDIAYLSPAKKVDSLYTMAAFDTTTDYSSTGSCMYALEMKDGVIKKWGLKVGDKIGINPAIKSKED